MNKERVAGSLPGIPMLLALIVAVIAVAVGIVFYIGGVLVPAGRTTGFDILGLLLRLLALVIIGFVGLDAGQPQRGRAARRWTTTARSASRGSTG